MSTADQTIQEWADAVVAAEYRQPLKTAEEACAAIGWEFANHPVCCGKEAVRAPWIMGTYHVECETCGKFIRDITGPQFISSGAARVFSSDGFPKDTDWSRTWIAGQREAA